MCGIAGFTHLGTRPDPAIVRRMRDSLIHRGPDQQGVWESDAISLTAVRLKIIDLAHGNQPMSAEEDGVTIAFNGEIYNHVALRNELENRGYRFLTRCDTEVVLHAFREWDVDCFAKLRGMFAVALWSETERRLVLARDRIGIKPLYVARLGFNLVFGSELKALFEHPRIERRLDPEGLALYLSLNYIPGPHTAISGIEKLGPGEWLDWTAGNERRARYWQVRFRPRPMGIEEAARELDTRLRDSVREHLISDVPLGVWLSGGLDSSTILHYAAEADPRLRTFSVSFRGRNFDESRYFRLMAERYGTEHEEFDLNPDSELPTAIEQLPYYADEPMADAGALPVWFLSRMTRRHVTVALSGEGADELFGGYATYLADRYARWLRPVPSLARRVALGVLRLWPVSDDKISLEYKLKRMLAGSLLSPDDAHFFWNGTFAPHETPLAARARAQRVLPSVNSPIGLLNRYLWVDQLNYLPDDILNKSDRMSMAHSLEVRPPFLDHRLIEFAATLPEDFKIRGTQLKFVLREVMRKHLPSEILARKKEGFDIPAHDWMRGALRQLLLDTVSPAAVRSMELFDARAIERTIAAHLSRRANFGYHLWGLLILFLWIRRWNVQPPERVAALREATAVSN